MLDIQHNIHENVILTSDISFSKADLVSSLVKCTWTLRKVQLAIVASKHQMQAYLSHIQVNNIYDIFYMSCNVFTNTMLFYYYVWDIFHECVHLVGRDLNTAKGSSFMCCKLMYVVLVLRGIIVPSSMGKKKNRKIRVLGFQSSQCIENVGC